MLVIIVGIIGVVGLVLGMFNVVFLMLVVIFGFIVWKLYCKGKVLVVDVVGGGIDVVVFIVFGCLVVVVFIVELSWDELCLVDLLGLEVGYWLILLVDSN